MEENFYDEIIMNYKKNQCSTDVVLYGMKYVRIATGYCSSASSITLNSETPKKLPLESFTVVVGLLKRRQFIQKLQLSNKLSFLLFNIRTHFVPSSRSLRSSLAFCLYSAYMNGNDSLQNNAKKKMLHLIQIS